MAIAGKITALPPKVASPAAGGGAGGAGGNADTSLPDPTSTAKGWLIGLLLLSVILSVVLNVLGLTSRAFVPSSDKTADFALFAGFYVAAQIIERLLEVIAPLLPFWTPPGEDEAVKAAHTKADRATLVMGFATLAGVAVSCGCGLYFLAAVGMTAASHTVDAIATGLTIGAGTKPLHDLITNIQNKNSPTTGTGVS